MEKKKYHAVGTVSKSNRKVARRKMHENLKIHVSKGGNQNPYIEGQTTQWPKAQGQKDKQRSTKHTHKIEDRVTRTPLKTRG